MNEQLIDYIQRTIPVEDLLVGLAEECAELAQAAIKLQRIIVGNNPAAIDRHTAFENITEEIADISLYLDALYYDKDRVDNIKQEKLNRWVGRLQNR